MAGEAGRHAERLLPRQQRRRLAPRTGAAGGVVEDAVEVDDRGGERAAHGVQVEVAAEADARLGFGRVVVSDIAATTMLVNSV